MNKLIKIATVILLFFGLASFMVLKNTSSSYKCLLQLKNYDENGAYVIISLINPEGNYEKTLYIAGDDSEWYEDMPNWWNFHNRNKNEDIDAITGESILTGERQQLKFKIDKNLIDKGYTLLFETAVEDNSYYKKDVEIKFSKESFGKKVNGTGYIRYVSISE